MFTVFKELKKNKALYLMSIPGIIWFMIFSYIPLLWIVVAFKQYNFVDGPFRSPWVGLENFKFYFDSMYFFRTTFNTLLLNSLFIIFGTIASVVGALMLNEVKNRHLKKLYQSTMFFPFFLSWIIVAALLYSFLNQSYGSVNILLKSLGLATVSWYSEPSLWRPILVFVAVWQGAGYGIVIYISVISSFDICLYEAAKIDGANRFHEIIFITLPQLVPTIIIMLLLSIGRIFYGNFQMIYSIIGDNGVLLPVTEVIDTYVYRAMKIQGEYGMAAAVGLYQSVMGFFTIIIANKLAKKYDENAGLF